MTGDRHAGADRPREGNACQQDNGAESLGEHPPAPRESESIHLSGAALAGAAGTPCPPVTGEEAYITAQEGTLKEDPQMTSRWWD